MAVVTGAQVAALLGRGDEPDLVALANEHLPITTAFVRAYVRGRGFDLTSGEPADDLAVVIRTATARLVVNPEHARSESVAGYSVNYATVAGFTLPELAILHRYRRRAL